MTVDSSNYPSPTYWPNKVVAAVWASLVFLSLIFWLAQSIRTRFHPRRLVILILVSHVAIFAELMIRATSNVLREKSQPAYAVMTGLYTIAQRTIIIGNYALLSECLEFRTRRVRAIFIGIGIGIGLGDLTMGIAGFFSFQSNLISLSFVFRQISTSIICFVTLVFYPIWLWTRKGSIMPCEAIMLLIVSSLTSVSIAIFLLLMSIPMYYVIINDDEQWFYFCQALPILIALAAWNTLHPRRSLRVTNQPAIKSDQFEKPLDYRF